MTKLKKIILLVLAMTFINIPFSSVCNAQNEEYVENVVYKTTVNTVTAKVDVCANNKKRILVLSAYKDGYLKNITADSQVVNGKQTLSASIDKSDADEVFATVIDAFDGSVLSQRAVYGTDSTALAYIRVNGKDIGYDDKIDEYWYQYSGSTVDVDTKVKDGTTKLTVSDYDLPGNAEINVVSASGKKRKIVVHLYETEDALSKLSGMKYKVGKDVYEIKDFAPNTKKYSISLDDNVMGVTLLPESMGDVSCMISNTTVSSINDVSLGSMYTTGSDAYQYKHNARNNYIPIKNEKTTAFVTVTSDGNSTEYQFDFISKQPRLTSFEYVGALDDSYRPVFVGGSAVNNDYGTILSTDRMWAVGNFSKELLGGSCFMLPAKNKESSSWWGSHTSGEYFNFTADTGCTVYVLSGNMISNTGEYSGWTIGNNSVELPENKSWVTVAKDWNDYSAKYFACAIEHQNNHSRAVNPGFAENDGDDTMITPVEMKYYAYKKFEAGEKVSIYHTGRTGNNAAKSTVIVVWDGVTMPVDDVEEEEEEEKDLPYDVIEDENNVLNVVFDNDTETTENVWLDRSGYHNDISLYTDENNKWVEEGFMAEGTAEGITELSDAVSEAISSNTFTLQFEVSALNYVDKKKCGILSSKNGNFEIYKNDTNDYVCFKWAGNLTALTMPRISVGQVVGHINTIVVDKDEAEEAQRIKWYIDGELVVTKKMSKTDLTADKIMLSTNNSTYAGNVVFKSISVYDKALSLDEITGGGAE